MHRRAVPTVIKHHLRPDTRRAHLHHLVTDNQAYSQYAPSRHPMRQTALSPPAHQAVAHHHQPAGCQPMRMESQFRPRPGSQQTHTPHHHLRQAVQKPYAGFLYHRKGHTQEHGRHIKQPRHQRNHQKIGQQEINRNLMKIIQNQRQRAYLSHHAQTKRHDQTFYPPLTWSQPAPQRGHKQSDKPYGQKGKLKPCVKQ